MIIIKTTVTISGIASIEATEAVVMVKKINNKKCFKKCNVRVYNNDSSWIYNTIITDVVSSNLDQGEMYNTMW